MPLILDLLCLPREKKAVNPTVRLMDILQSLLLAIKLSSKVRSADYCYTAVTMKYTLFEGKTDATLYESINDETREVMKKLLARRGFYGKEEIQDFLQPNYGADVRDPFGIVDMEKAAERVVLALRSGEKICVYSDYDCDGIPGGAVLSDFFDHIGYTNRVHYIPHRHKEGYGLNKGAIDILTNDGVTLMITVDNGITNVEEVAYAEEKGIDTIVTDHHLLLRDEKGKQLLPPAFAVINSKRDDCTYHDDMLCGCAVAWKLACAVLVLLRKDVEVVGGEGKPSLTPKASGKVSKKVIARVNFTEEYKKILEKVKMTKEGWEKWWLDLVAISTIADMVPLRKENRALAHFGLQVLRKSSRPGLQKLLALTKTKQQKLTAMDIAFTIAPRVNAASRMADPRLAFEMMRGSEPVVAIARAEEIEKLNTLRKETVKEIKREVMGYDLSAHTHVIVIGSEAWTPGVLGLIAQQVLDETGKAVFVWGAGEQVDEYKGSCRAPEHVDLVALMSACEEGTLLGFGGHALAGGFSVSKEKKDILPMKLNQAYEKLDLSRDAKEEETVVDSLLSFDEVTSALHKELEKIEPCGEGNPRPLFAFVSEGALSVRKFGKQGGHFELLYSQIKKHGVLGEVKAIYFFGEEEKLSLAKGPHTLIAELEESHFGWKPELRLRVVDIIKSL